MPSLYETTIAVFIHELSILTTLLKAGISHAATGAVTEQSLVDARLIADMQTLAYQIQRVSDTSKGFAVRVGKVEPVSFEDNEKSFPELLERIAKTVKFLEAIKEEDINKNEDSEVVLKTGSTELKFSAKKYALTWAVPNFYFHFVTAYDILRAQGVPIGKKNYLGGA